MLTGKDEELGFGPNMKQKEIPGLPLYKVRPYKVPHRFQSLNVVMVLEGPLSDLQAYQDPPVKGHLSPSGNCTMLGLGPRLVRGSRTGTR